jgi:choline dehydrogenase-like flavoprotein
VRTWRVDFTLADEPGASSRSVTADVVVLTAGTLGTAQILLRSRALGLPVSGWGGVLRQRRRARVRL